VKSKCTSRFWKLYHALPTHVQARARRSYDLWKHDYHHPSLDFKKLKGGATNRFLSEWALITVQSVTS
jgi:hypothetical protein